MNMLNFLLLFLRGSTFLEKPWPPYYPLLLPSLLYATFRNKKYITGWCDTTPNPQPTGPVEYT